VLMKEAQTVRCVLCHLADPVVPRPRSARCTPRPMQRRLFLFSFSLALRPSCLPTYLVLRNFVEREAGTLCPPDGGRRRKRKEKKKKKRKKKRKEPRYRCTTEIPSFFPFSSPFHFRRGKYDAPIRAYSAYSSSGSGSETVRQKRFDSRLFSAGESAMSSPLPHPPPASLTLSLSLSLSGGMRSPANRRC